MRRAAVVLVVLVVAGCANYEGDGNEFVVEGEVVEIGSQSLKVRVSRVVDDNGEADGWFDVGHGHRFHDNCDCHGMWNGRKRYGDVYGYSGEIVGLDSLSGAECVTVTGKIRSHQEGKTFHNRPVFDRVDVRPCG